MPFPDIPIDGNWVDIGSLVTGGMYAIWRKINPRTRSKWISKDTGIDFANGVALFPQFVLMFCVLSSHLVRGLVESSKMSLSVAGFFAILAILDDANKNNSMFR